MADFDVFLYFSGNPKEPLIWDSEFSYCFNAVLNRIFENPPRIMANINVPFATVVKKIDDYEAKGLRSFVLILGGEDRSVITFEPVKEFVGLLSPEQQGNILIVCRPQKRIVEIPDFLQKFPIYNFYELVPANQIIVEYNLNEKGIHENSFLEKVTDLAYDLKYLLDSNINRDISETRDNTIFLAEVTPDQYKNRERLRRELIYAGYHVIPNSPLAVPLKDFEEDVREQMENSILTIHMMGEQYGNSPEETDYSYPEIQNRLFLEISKKNQAFSDVQPKINRIVWIQSLFDPYEEKQVQYMKRLRRDINVSKDSELIQSTIYDLKSIIDQKFATFRAPIEELLPVESGVLIIADDYRDVACNAIKEEFHHASLNFILFKAVANMQNDLALLMNEMKKYKHILVLNTKGDSMWLQSMLNLLARSKGYQGAIAPCLVGLFSPSPTKRIQEFHTLTIDSYIYSSKNINNILQSFITKVKT